MKEYTLFVYIDAETDAEALEWAKGIVYPSSPIHWEVQEND